MKKKRDRQTRGIGDTDKNMKKEDKGKQGKQKRKK